VLEELPNQPGEHRRKAAIADFPGSLAHQNADAFKGFSFPEREAIHNLKCYNWIEQQGKASSEWIAQWKPDCWREQFGDEEGYFDGLIVAFNRQAGAPF
jgi:hypothetical protein